MSSAGNKSMHSRVTAHGRQAALVAASIGLVFFAAVSAAEPPVTVEYQSSFTGYRRFDAQAPTVAWRQANDAIVSGSDGAAHGMHGMHGPTEPAPADNTESQPTTSDDHREHRQ
jgi:hypothetical protein